MHVSRYVDGCHKGSLGIKLLLCSCFAWFELRIQPLKCTFPAVLPPFRSVYAAGSTSPRCPPFCRYLRVFSVVCVSKCGEDTVGNGFCTALPMELPPRPYLPSAAQMTRLAVLHALRRIPPFAAPFHPPNTTVKPTARCALPKTRVKTTGKLLQIAVSLMLFPGWDVCVGVCVGLCACRGGNRRRHRGGSACVSARTPLPQKTRGRSACGAQRTPTSTWLLGAVGGGCRGV